MPNQVLDQALRLITSFPADAQKICAKSLLIHPAYLAGGELKRLCRFRSFEKKQFLDPKIET